MPPTYSAICGLRAARAPEMSSVMVTPTPAWISKSAQPLPFPARRKPSSIHGAMAGSPPGAGPTSALDRRHGGK